jgi:hypothetical protein
MFTFIIFASTCSPMFLLASCIFDYLRTVADLVWICFPSFHIRFFPSFYSFVNFWKSSKIKFLEKFQKILIKFLCLKWGREAPGITQGGHHATTPQGGVGQGQVGPWHGVGAPGPPHLLLHRPFHSLSRKNSTPLLKPVFLLFLLAIFDLLAQPIFAAEIWSICFSVCDSSDCPSRILFSGVFLEYFDSVGDRLNEFACLFYCLDKLFWCMLALLQVPIVVSFICLSQNHFYEVC